MIAAAPPGLKARFVDGFGVGPDLVYDIVAYQEDPDDPEKVEAMVVVPGWTVLATISAIPLPPGYNFAGIGYCP